MLIVPDAIIPGPLLHAEKKDYEVFQSVLAALQIKVWVKVIVSCCAALWWVVVEGLTWKSQ